MSREEITAHLEPARYIGRCSEQVEEFLLECVQPKLRAYGTDQDDAITQLKV